MASATGVIPSPGRWGLRGGAGGPHSLQDPGSFSAQALHPGPPGSCSASFLTRAHPPWLPGPIPLFPRAHRPCIEAHPSPQGPDLKLPVSAKSLFQILSHPWGQQVQVPACLCEDVISSIANAHRVSVQGRYWWPSAKPWGQSLETQREGQLWRSEDQTPCQEVWFEWEEEWQQTEGTCAEGSFACCVSRWRPGGEAQDQVGVPGQSLLGGERS